MAEEGMAENGMITIASDLPVGETIDRLAELATAKGLSIFARIDHAGGAAKVGMELRPTQLLIFGNPNGGTPLMQDRQTAGIDLPLKALAFEDENGRVWLAYDDPGWIAARHGLGAESRKAVDAIATGIAALTKSAATR
jgi:uncharacterized protein (DUF302 family)